MIYGDEVALLLTFAIAIAAGGIAMFIGWVVGRAMRMRFDANRALLEELCWKSDVMLERLKRMTPEERLYFARRLGAAFAEAGYSVEQAADAISELTRRLDAHLESDDHA